MSYCTITGGAEDGEWSRGYHALTNLNFNLTHFGHSGFHSGSEKLHKVT